jgi:hypothetical protein
MRESK